VEKEISRKGAKLAKEDARREEEAKRRRSDAKGVRPGTSRPLVTARDPEREKGKKECDS
jgi:hypothetical protein